MNWYISTTADLNIEMLDDGSYRTINTNLSIELSEQFGTGIELAEFCMGDSLGDDFADTDRVVRKKMKRVRAGILHAPFNELFPCAIDKEAAALAEKRYLQAIHLADSYHIPKVVIHSGYTPSMYFDPWFIEQSSRFWKSFMDKHSFNATICLENVMETAPTVLKELMLTLNEPRIGLCLDIGHAFRCSKYDPIVWLKDLSPWLKHFHIHDNNGEYDTHEAPGEGCIDIDSFLAAAERLCPNASFTIESLDAEKACQWLKEHAYL